MVCSADEGQQAVQSSASFFSWHHMVYCFMYTPLRETSGVKGTLEKLDFGLDHGRLIHEEFAYKKSGAAFKLDGCQDGCEQSVESSSVLHGAVPT